MFACYFFSDTYLVHFLLSFSKCLEEAWKIPYGGGIIQNPEFEHGSEGWTVFGHGNIEERTTKSGNRFITIVNRTQPYDSLAQRVQLQKGKLYAFSGNFNLFSSSTSTLTFKQSCTLL